MVWEPRRSPGQNHEASPRNAALAGEASALDKWSVTVILRFFVNTSINDSKTRWIVCERTEYPEMISLVSQSCLWIRCEFLLKCYLRSLSVFILPKLSSGFLWESLWQSLSSSLKLHSKWFCSFEPSLKLSLNSLRAIFELLISKFCLSSCRIFSLSLPRVLLGILIAFPWFSLFSGLFYVLSLGSLEGL